MTARPITMMAIFNLVVVVMLGGLAYSIRHSDPATFQFIVGALVSLITGQSIHLGRQTTDMIRGNQNGNGDH